MTTFFTAHGLSSYDCLLAYVRVPNRIVTDTVVGKLLARIAIRQLDHHIANANAKCGMVQLQRKEALACTR